MTITPIQSEGVTLVNFTVTGQSGSEGFGNLTLSKSAIPYGTTPTVYIDGQPAANQGYTEDANNYYIWFTTHFSTHEIAIQFIGAELSGQPLPLSTLLAILAVIVIACLVAAVELYRRQKTKTR
jgi:hypothetical protein